MDLFEGPGSQCGDYLQVCVSELIWYMHFYAYVSEEIVKILLLIIFYQDIWVSSFAHIHVTTTNWYSA